MSWQEAVAAAQLDLAAALKSPQSELIDHLFDAVANIHNACEILGIRDAKDMLDLPGREGKPQ